VTRLSYLERLVFEAVQCSGVALSVREICVLLNKKTLDYCLNVDGQGSRCAFFYRRPRHESQKIRLARPSCRINALRVIEAVNSLVKRGLLRKVVVHLRDELSSWNHDNFRLVYVNEKQLRRRLKTVSLLKFTIE